MNRQSVLRAFLMMISLVPVPATAWAVVAQHDAASPAYADGWQAGDNGGSGFGPWAFGFSGDLNDILHGAPQFIDTAPLAGDSLGAPSFALTTSDRPFFFDTSETTRPFAAPLAVGQTFSIDVNGSAFNANAPGFSVGNTVQLMGDVGGERFGIFTNNQFNDDHWTAGGVDTGVAGSASFHAALTITGIDTFDFVMTPIGGGAPLYAVTGATLGGTAGTPITSLRFTAYGTGSSADGSKELFFDNLLVVPEPNSCVIALVAASVVSTARRSSRQGRRQNRNLDE